MRRFSFLFLLLVSASVAHAHDTWVQTNTNLTRVGDLVHVDLMLGNHGNEHRDFKLASKISLDPCTLSVLTPSGESYDLKPDLIDTGYAPKEGFWSARFVTGAPGLHCVVHTLDTLHRTTRAIKSSKTYFLASDSLDQVSSSGADFDAPLGHPLELVLQSHPVRNVGPGQPIRVQVLYEGQPLEDARVSFIPRGQALAEGFDKEYERMADEQGLASFTPREGNYYLVVVHHRAHDQKGDGYDATAYSATLAIFVPQLCSCCE
ncbi:DUF4198 domain-containing protein [Candidatus Laterigemmans baculatus]|uniref:DUF4198 domain-containing protein n=1 Tax=Candidatus Laterigemmans baculatus TaxID=2770505 RepID=UPI0013D91A2D|nr:DUF4198 domain-containing protein [Candidatus Laterigemmans baculatus]